MILIINFTHKKLLRHTAQLSNPANILYKLLFHSLKTFVRIKPFILSIMIY